jgi:multicomponent Na+:H+ antiporter subunit B
MTGLWTEIPLPGGPLKLGTPLLFDVGVFTLVVGFSSAVLLTLEERHG